MRIRKPHKVAQSHDYGVSPPFQALLTCTYQKLFKKDAFIETTIGTHASCDLGWIQGAPRVAKDVMVQRYRRHESGRPNGRQEIKEELNNLDVHESDHGDADMQDLVLDHGAQDTLVPKRRKVKSGRYTGYAAKDSDGTSNVAHEVAHYSNNDEKRCRKISKENSIENIPCVNIAPNSKEALISSIFYVFDTLGKSGLTASEVVGIMLEQNLPGLKEGGARHTVQVANVLRRSPHFVSIGNKRYLPCSVLEERHESKKQNHGSQETGSVTHSRYKQAHKRRKLVNTECKLYDGTGWQCNQQTQPGYSLCVSHLDLINKRANKVEDTSLSTKNLNESSLCQHEAGEFDSDREDSEEVGPPITKWGRERNPGIPMQKRKMLSLMSIK